MNECLARLVLLARRLKLGCLCPADPTLLDRVPSRLVSLVRCDAYLKLASWIGRKKKEEEERKTWRDMLASFSFVCFGQMDSSAVHARLLQHRERSGRVLVF